MVSDTKGFLLVLGYMSTVYATFEMEDVTMVCKPSATFTPVTSKSDCFSLCTSTSCFAAVYRSSSSACAIIPPNANCGPTYGVHGTTAAVGFGHTTFANFDEVEFAPIVDLIPVYYNGLGVVENLSFRSRVHYELFLDDAWCGRICSLHVGCNGYFVNRRLGMKPTCTLHWFRQKVVIDGMNAKCARWDQATVNGVTQFATYFSVQEHIPDVPC